MSDLDEAVKQVEVDEGLAKAVLDCVLRNPSHLAIVSNTFQDGTQNIEFFKRYRKSNESSDLILSLMTLGLKPKRFICMNRLFQYLKPVDRWNPNYDLRPLYEFLRQHREEYGIKEEMPELPKD